jgi:hypothetical protein
MYRFAIGWVPARRGVLRRARGTAALTGLAFVEPDCAPAVIAHRTFAKMLTLDQGSVIRRFLLYLFDTCHRIGHGDITDIPRTQAIMITVPSGLTTAVTGNATYTRGGPATPTGTLTVPMKFSTLRL